MGNTEYSGNNEYSEHNARLTCYAHKLKKNAKTWFKTNVSFSKTRDTNIKSMGLTVKYQQFSHASDRMTFDRKIWG